MRNTKRNLVFTSILLFAAFISQSAAIAEDGTSERAKKGEVEDNEQLPNPEDELHKPANTWPQGSFVIIAPGGQSGSHLGPTGLWGDPMGQNILVKKVDSNSPADGKVLPDDFIYGVGGKNFSADRDPRYYLSIAITKAETKEAGGKLVLDIRRDGELIQVPIQLEVMGSFSATSPFNCEKSDKIVVRAEEYMRKGLRPETGFPDNNKYMYAPWNDSVLFLMASGNPELQGLVRRYIRNTIDDIEDWKAWVQKRGGGFNTYNGWGTDFLKLLFGEYYHRTGDSSVLPYLQAMSNGTFDRGPNPNKPQVKPKSKSNMNWSWPPKEPTGYGTHPHAHMAQVMGTILASEAGLKINKEKLLFDLKYLYVKRAEYGFVGYHGYGPQPIKNRQVDKPVEMTQEEKNTGTFSAMNGKPAMAAALFSMLNGYEKAVELCSERSVYAYNRTHKGHGGVWFNGFWTPIGASHAGPEKFQFFMKGQQWWRELYRDHTGAMWQVGNAREKKDTLGTGFAIHRTIPRKKLRMLGAPRSMFGPAAPAYIKEALAAHRKRDYALAEQLTLKLQADGKVPAEDKERFSHFLDSVKTLKESVEYDLTFTEALLAKNNYGLASIELSQLKMVVAPDNPRLKAIEKVIEPKKDQIPTRDELEKERVNAYVKAFSLKKNARKEGFKKEVANTLTLLKDGVKHKAGKGHKPGTHYPTFPKQEWNKWRMYVMNTPKHIPEGWEQVDYDDSKWKEITLPSKWQETKTAILRTSFEAKDLSTIETLRIRGVFRSLHNIIIYLNGQVVAKGAEFPAEIIFDLKPSAIKLLKQGKNTLAIKVSRKYGKHNFSFRLDAIRGKLSQNINNPPKPKAETKKNSREKKPKTQQKTMIHHDEIKLMLANLKNVQPKVKVGKKMYPALKVHDYLLKLYMEHKNKITTTDIFLNKLASKTVSGLIYYVVEDNGGKIMLKDWLKKSLTHKVK